MIENRQLSLESTDTMSERSNATLTCIKLLLTVFNFVFWVSSDRLYLARTVRVTE